MEITNIMELLKYGLEVVLAVGLFYIVYIYVCASVKAMAAREKVFFETLEAYRLTIERQSKESAEAHAKVSAEHVETSRVLASLVTSTQGLEKAVARINGYK